MRLVQGILDQQNKEGEEEEELDQEQIMLNAKAGYEVFISNGLQSTSHSVQWMPLTQNDPEHESFTQEHFLIGTHFDEESPEFGKDKLMIVKVRVPKISRSEKTIIDSSKLPQDCSRIEIVKQWSHEGEVNKARYNPHNKDMVASLTNSGEVHIFNSKDESASIKLQGLNQEGFGLSWSPKQDGMIVSASGQQVSLWDLSHNNKSVWLLNEAHQKSINDVKFSPLNPNLFITASDDGNYKIWDVKANNFVHCFKASEDELMTASFNNFEEHIFATGGQQDGTISIWDIRMPKQQLNDLEYHKKQVTQLEWSPFYEQYLMSASQDKRVIVWDYSKVGEEQARHDFEDGPPELLMSHELHLENVEDISWSPNQEHFVASVDTIGNMQVWRMAEIFFEQETDYLEKLDKIKDMELE